MESPADVEERETVVLGSPGPQARLLVAEENMGF